MHSICAAYLYRWCTFRGPSVCVRHTGEPCKSGRTDRNAVSGADSCGPKEPCFRRERTLNQSISQSINQSCIFRVVQVIKPLQDPLAMGHNLTGIDDNVRERGLEQKCVKRWRKVDRDRADIRLSGRLFQMVGHLMNTTELRSVCGGDAA